MPDTTIRIKTQADLAALQQLDTAYKALSRSEQQATRDALALASSMARLDAATKGPAAGVDRLRAALGGLNAAPARQVAGLQTQLAKLETQADRTGKGLAVLPRSLEFLSSQAVGQLSGVLFGPQLVANTVRFGIEAGRAGLKLDYTLRLTKELTGSQAQYNYVIETARQQQFRYGGSLQENIAGIQGLVVTARSSGAELRSLIDLSQRLTVLDPAQGAEGARIALSEVLSGDPRSLSRRYEIPLSALNKIKDTTIPVVERLKVLDDYLNKIGITSKVVDGAVSEQARAYNQLGIAVDDLRTKIGTFLATGFAPAAQATAQILSGQTEPALRSFNARMAESVGVNKDQAAQLATGKTAIENYNAAMAQYYGVQVQANAVQQQHAEITLRAADADDRAAAALTTKSAAVSEDIQKMAQAQANAAALAQTQAQLDADSRLAAQGLLGAGDNAIILAQKYGIATEAAQALINAQQRVSNAAALQEQRAGERSPGSSGASEVAAQEERRLQQVYRRLDQSQKAVTSGGGSRARTVEQIARAEERAADALERQRKAAIDLALAEVDDRRQRRLENAQAAAARRILSDPQFAGTDQALAAQETLDRIPLEQSKRAEERARLARDAGAQGIPSGAGTTPAGAGGSGAGAGAASTPPAPPIIITADGREIARVVLPYLRSGRAQVVATG